MSAGFGGEVKIWRFVRAESTAAAIGKWAEVGRVVTANGTGKKGGVGEVWAVALSDTGRYLATSAYDGRICVWDLLGNGGEGFVRVREYETKGSFGLSVAIVSSLRERCNSKLTCEQTGDGRLVASGHENGSVYIFNNDSGRMVHSLPGKVYLLRFRHNDGRANGMPGLVRAVRAVAFSPATKLLAAAGDARIIALYDVSSGEQVANLSGHSAWIMSLDFSSTGEYLLSG